MNTKRLCLALCGAVTLCWMGVAAAQSPSAQELLAEQDQALVNELASWVTSVFSLPDELSLDPPLRQAATDLAKTHIEQVRGQLPRWIAQERAAAGNPGLRGNALSKPLYLRAINELAILSIESAGSTYDEAWIKAFLASKACSYADRRIFARRIAMIQAAPIEARSALLEGEKQLLSRWGSPRQNLPERPSAAQLSAADHAIARLRAGQPVDALPMTALLAGKLFSRDRKPDRLDKLEQCAKSQWWLASQLLHGNIDRTQALTVYRYATMVDAREFVPASVAKKAAAAQVARDKPRYPPVAAYCLVEGVTTLQTEIDDQGKFIRAEVVSRSLKVPGVRDNRPIAFETLLDAAALEYAENNRSNMAEQGTSRKFEVAWRLGEDQDASR